MKIFKYTLITLVALTVYFGVKDLTVDGVLKAGVEKGWGTLNYWFGGNINASNNRPLPPNQGDDSEAQLTPIEELKDIE